jgi:hypothetical protein
MLSRAWVSWRDVAPRQGRFSTGRGRQPGKDSAMQDTPPHPSQNRWTPQLRIPLFGAVVRPLQRFFSLEASSGIVLLAAAIAALVLGEHLSRDL